MCYIVNGQQKERMTMAKLYLVGTPIGNLKDISQRALDTLRQADAIACEDTRHSLKLLNYYDIKKPLFACHKFNEKESVDKIYAMLCEGKDVALVTDAGMPAVSDPGAVVVNGLSEKGVDITVIPGPTALTTAMALSGIIQPVFTFIGFLPSKTKDKDSLVLPFKDITTSLVFYSSPYDVDKDIAYLYSRLGDRKLHIIRELTKIHEQHIVTTLAEGFEGEAKGEYVLIVECGEKIRQKPCGSIKEQLISLIENGMDKKSAVKQVAKANSLTRDEVYKEALDIEVR